MIKIMRLVLAVFCLVWLSSGFFIIRGNEQGLLRRFGRARPEPVLSGLHFDLPWPLSQVDRVNVQEVQTLTIGVAAIDSEDPNGFLRPVGLDRAGEFVTGDKNLLNLQVHVQYRIAEPYRWLCRVESPEVTLRLLAESRIAEAIAQSGVDYVHPTGLNELRGILTVDLSQRVEQAELGASIEDVTIGAVWPPIEVKAAFLDVSNARAERDQLIEQQRSKSEQLLTASRTKANQLVENAQTEQRIVVEGARGEADRFRRLVNAMSPEQSEKTPLASHQVRQRALQRMFLDSMVQFGQGIGRIIVIETDQPIDLRLFPGRSEPIDSR